MNMYVNDIRSTIQIKSEKHYVIKKFKIVTPVSLLQ